MRKRKRWLRLGILLFILLTVCGVQGISVGKHMRFIKQLGVGYNMGNSLDATGLREYKPDASDLSYEISWGNPKITQKQFALIYQAGFSSVRIPVTWEDHMNNEGIVSEEWMTRVVEVVDMALEEKLYVILDTHHESWMNLEIEREAEITEKFKILWTQIAKQFTDYGDKLIFEGMNEPRLRDSAYEWTAGTVEMRDMVNRLNQVFVQAVRATGGKNKDRYLLICAYATNHEEEALRAVEVPKGNIAVAVHMYAPYSFCQDDDGTTEWDVQNQESVEQMQEIFKNIKEIFTSKNIPVVITEFGCKDKGNTKARAKWIRFCRELAAKSGTPCFWWDNGSSYRLMEREEGVWVYPKLLEALVQ